MKWTIFCSIHLKVHVPKFSPTTVHPAMSCSRGDVLCDGRQDPFVTKDSLGVLGWTAFERSMHGFSEYLPEIVNYDHPDYVITSKKVSYKLLKEWTQKFGQPVFTGTYGSVFSFIPE